MTIVRLGDFAKLQTKKINNLRSRSFSYVSTENLLPNKNGITFPATSIPTTKKINSYNSGDILVSNIRPYFKKIWMATNSGTHSSDVLNFKTDSSKLTQEYLYTILESDRFFDYVSLTAKGTKMPRGDKNAILDFQFNLPKLDEQKKFSNTILALENKILTLHKINDNLLDLASTLFEDSFPNARDGENTIGTLMGNFDKQRKPLSKNQRAQRQGEYRYIGATSVVDYVDDFTFDGIYLLLGEDGTVQTYDGKPVLQYVWGPFWPNNHTHVLQGKGVSTEWLYLFWKNQNITSIITGAVQPKISQGNMNSVKVTKPSDDELATFQQKIDPIFNMIRLNTDEIENLKVIRDQLLKELLG